MGNMWLYESVTGPQKPYREITVFANIFYLYTVDSWDFYRIAEQL